MHDLSAWSLNLGRWGGIRIRLHALFLLFAVATLYLCATASGSDREMFWLCGMALSVLLASVVLHELAHGYAIWRVGGYVDQIVLGPFGGLTVGSVPRIPQRELIAAAAGPLINLLVAAVALLLLLATGHRPWRLLHPLLPVGLTEGSHTTVGLNLIVWVNWGLMLVNLLPAYPFDGGRMLKSVLWPAIGYRTARLVVARTAKVTSLLLVLLAWMSPVALAVTPNVARSTMGVPPWVPLVMLAIFLFFSANLEVSQPQHRDREHELFGYDFSQGFTSFQRDEAEAKRSHGGMIRRWRRRRRAAKQQQLRDQEALEEARVDAILARLHESSIDALPAKDRALLERVSARYRNRLQS